MPRRIFLFIVCLSITYAFSASKAYLKKIRTKHISPTMATADHMLLSSVDLYSRLFLAGGFCASFSHAIGGAKY